MSVEFSVFGLPATKGSTVSFVGDGGVVVTKADCANLASWTRTVGWAARAARVPLHAREVPVRVHVVFWLPGPKKQRRGFPTVRPDLDKLLRALLDALTGVAYEDDAQVVEVLAMKTYGHASEAHTIVTVSEVGRPADAAGAA